MTDTDDDYPGIAVTVPTAYVNGLETECDRLRAEVERLQDRIGDLEIEDRDLVAKVERLRALAREVLDTTHRPGHLDALYELDQAITPAATPPGAET